MIWSIPNNKGEIRINTPINVKSLRGLFFEVKGGVQKDNQRISIQVGNREIVRDIPIILFMDIKRPINFEDNASNDIDGFYLYDWKDSIIDLNINVDNTEVIIKCSNISADNVNIVFVCDFTNVTQENYTFFEVFKLPYVKGIYNIQTIFPPDRIFTYGFIENRPTDVTSPYYNDVYILTLKDLLKMSIMISDDMNGKWFDFFHDIVIMSVFRRIPVKKALYFLGNKTSNNIKVELQVPSVSLSAQKYLYIVFGYKKI